jgi:hydroxyethylthiazole kinase-like uncharacterized protein yjeF
MFNSLVLGRSQMKDLDRLANSGRPETGFQYMLKAGFGAAKILELKWGPFDGDSIMVVAGKGNNGGDALITALQLKDLGAHVEVILVNHPENYRGEALMAWQIFQESAIKWSLWEGKEVDWGDCEIIVDGILGLGAEGSLRENLVPLVDSIQEASDEGCFLFSLDQPTGKLEADATALFGFTRWECLDPMTADPFGEVGVVDLEYPEALIREVIGLGDGAKILDPQWYLPFIPVRDRFGDKRAHGTGLLIAGGPYMGGAAILAGLGALRLGLGYLKIACDPGERWLVQSELIEAPFVNWTEIAQNDLTHFWDEFDSVAMGPGLGLASEVQARVLDWYRDFPRTLVLDADGINRFKGRAEELREHAGARILTPHEKEFERVFGKLEEDLQSRARRVREVAMEYGIELLLKGPVSILASSKGEVSLYNQGSSALARAGSGDVLAGILLALSSRWLAPELSYPVLCLGVWLHGMAAEIAKDENSEISMRSAEIPNYLGAAVDSLLGIMTQETSEYGDLNDDEETFSIRLSDLEDDSEDEDDEYGFDGPTFPEDEF